MPTVTMQDVANYAGVSKTTVSRVMNNDPTVAPELRVRVSKAVQDLGYQPNRTARRLRASSSDIIGVIISDIQNPFFVSLIEGIEEMSYANHLTMLLCNTNEDPARQQLYLDVMEAERVAGLILAPAPNTDTDSLRRLKQAHIPVVLLDRWINHLDTDAVMIDNVRGAFVAVKHLLDLGYEQIAMIAGSSELTTGRERQQGYRDALQAAGIQFDETLMKIGNSRRDSGYSLTYELIQSEQRPRAIFVANSLMTLGALQALHELHIGVPQEVAVVGFDDMPWSGALCPPLTAISQPTYEIGQEAVHLLLRRMADPNAPARTVTLQTQLIVRESSGAVSPLE